jgi:hypothetical protein
MVFIKEALRFLEREKLHRHGLGLFYKIFSSNEVSSISNSMEQLKCFFYYLVLLLVGQKKDVITYKIANDISSF